MVVVEDSDSSGLGRGTNLRASCSAHLVCPWTQLTRYRQRAPGCTDAAETFALVLIEQHHHQVL